MPEFKRTPEIQDFGRRLKVLRKAAGATQQAVAWSVGIDQQYYSGIERGTRNPTLLLVFRIAAALKVPAHKLFEPD